VVESGRPIGLPANPDFETQSDTASGAPEVADAEPEVVAAELEVAPMDAPMDFEEHGDAFFEGGDSGIPEVNKLGVYTFRIFW